MIICGNCGNKLKNGEGYCWDCESVTTVRVAPGVDVAPDKPQQGITIRYSAEGIMIDATDAEVPTAWLDWATIVKWQKKYMPPVPK